MGNAALSENYGLILVAYALGSLPVLGHLGHTIAGGERRISLDLANETSPRLQLALGLSEELARVERSKADRDQNGEISPDEAGARLDRAAAELARSIEICSGPRLTELACRKLDPGAVTGAAASGWAAAQNEPRTLEFTFRLELAGASAIEVRDASNEFPTTRTDVKIFPPTSSPLRRAGPNRNEPGIALEFGYDDELLAGAPRTLAAEWQPARRNRRSILIGLAAAAAVLILVALLRRFRKQPESNP
jgi:hypothetical protein